jgi:hypothetical protein
MMAFVLLDALEDIKRLALWHVRKQQCQIDRPWVREEQRAHFYKLKRIHCPYIKCEGHFSYKLENVKDHLIHNGRDASFRVWRGPCNRIYLNEKWEEELKVPNRQ